MLNVYGMNYTWGSTGVTSVDTSRGCVGYFETSPPASFRFGACDSYTANEKYKLLHTATAIQYY
jgi:hypothetical protein